MKLHQQFDLNLGIANELGNNRITAPQLIEELVISLVQKGYIVLKSASKVMGIPQSITIIKETGPAITVFASAIKQDFSEISKRLGVENLFE